MGTIGMDPISEKVRKKVQTIRERHEKACPGPWRWFGNTRAYTFYLATVGRGRRYIMDFVRWGMSGAQPRFQVYPEGRDPFTEGLMTKGSELVEYEVPYRKDFARVDNPDAIAIEHSWQDVEDLLEVCDRAFERIETERARWMRQMDFKAGAEIHRNRVVELLRSAVAAWEKTNDAESARKFREAIGGIGGGAVTFEGVDLPRALGEEGNRLIALLALAELSLTRPGWEDATRSIAVLLRGEVMFDSFREISRATLLGPVQDLLDYLDVLEVEVHVKDETAETVPLDRKRLAGFKQAVINALGLEATSETYSEIKERLGLTESA